MPQQLNNVLEELNLTQYFSSLVDHGFDTWNTILDITESDMDAMGVKLGHRRKLQRRIANFRGIAPDVALASSAQTSEDASQAEAAMKQDYSMENRQIVPGVLAKRKYRRHPKADESAPERPPSAYVLFSNKIRDDLRGRTMTFTEIAKHVGECWQGLSATEREPYETQAQVAKDKYHSDMAEYKKTDTYKDYMKYLHDFRAKQLNLLQEKNALKGPKVAEFPSTSIYSHEICLGFSPTHSHHHLDDSEHAQHDRQHNKRQRDAVDDHSSRSGSEGLHDCATQNSRKRRCGSPGSASDYSVPPTPTTADHLHGGALHDASNEDLTSLYRSPLPSSPHLRHSRPASQSPRTQHESSALVPSRSSGNTGDLDKTSARHLNLPSLSHMFDANYHQRSAASAESNTNTNGRASPDMLPHSLSMSNSNASNTSIASAASSTYFAASNGSSASSIGSGSHPRTPLDGMPIHALLSGGAVKQQSPPSPSRSSVSPHSASMPTYSQSQSQAHSYPQAYAQPRQQHLAQQYHHASAQHSPQHQAQHLPQQYQQPACSQQHPCPVYPHSHMHHGPAQPYQHAVSPTQSPPPPTAWPYGHIPAPVERRPLMHQDHGFGSTPRHAAPTYHFRS
ncbi:hypothetical protein SEPCBS57363_005112 [Sporothrix epigloea]|uniref:HMG box domain-containing protein n=1 Tax=Sporothrix epigloea TaxID=1892477 RepID=A0ABP0DWX7_9PEZI